MAVVFSKVYMGIIMNMFKAGCAALLFLFSVLQLNVSMSAEPEPGFISFFADDTFVCRVKIEEGQTALFDKEKDCSSPAKKIGYIQLENVRSAVTIIISANMGHNPQPPIGCWNGLGFEYTLRTTKNNLSTDKISVVDLYHYNVDLPVVPGLLLKKKYFAQSNDFNTVRCLKIRFD